MSNFPTGYDDDSTLPPVNDNIDQIGGDAINALRDVVMAIEQTLGLNVAGSAPNLAARLGVFINPDGTPNASIIYALGLVTLPITNVQIAQAAGIEESKLLLDYKTSDLFNYIRDLAKDVNLAIGWISVSGVKLEPHLIGALYRHDLAQIDVAETSTQFLNNVFRVLRDNTDAYTLINDMNNELLAHQWADGSPFGVIQNIITNDGSIYPSNYAHVASGIFLDTTSFAVIPQTAINEQLAWEFIDQNSLFLLGTRVQNLYANGISVNSRSSSLTTDGYGQPIVPPTPAIAYLRDTGSASFPFDDINMGDDIIQFVPTNDVGFSFEEQFALVRVGDIVRVNYANDGYFIEVPFIISEKKYIPGATPTFLVRIAGKNFAYSPNAVARIDKGLFNNNKKGVLAVSGVSSAGLPLGTMPSLIVSNPRGAQCLGVGFSPDEFNETHYFLYLAIYPTGNPLDGYSILPGIDVTGNQGTTPGSYTLQQIVDTTNAAFRQPGFNYRFVAFDYEGEFGIMLSDAYNNVSFSVINGIVTTAGFYSQSLSQLNFPQNVIDVFPSAQTVTTGATFSLPAGTISVASTAGFNSSGNIQITTSTNGIQTVTYGSIVGNTFQGCSLGTGSVPTGSAVTQQLVGVTAPDPLGFGPFGAAVSSPPFMSVYGSYPDAVIPTVIFPPLRRNNFYVNGTEQEKLLNYQADGQVQDQYGDGYWIATVQSVNPGASNVAITYLVPLDLSRSGLKAGKTLVVQPADGYNFGLVDYGRFVISNVTFTCCPPVQTEITVYDAVHGVGGSPYPVLALGSTVGLYFNNDSVSFNNETATDFTVLNYQFKRHFEVYVDDNGATFTHERARFYPNGANGSSIAVNGASGALLYTNNSFATMDIYDMSPTLRGYQHGNVNKINLQITDFDSASGQITGFLSDFDGTNFLSQGPVTTGKLGERIRFYDRSFVDFIEIIFEFIVPAIPTFTNQYIDIQLFPTLSLDQEVMLLGTVEVNGTNVGQFQDLRQFGNTSEQQFTTSALDYIALPEKLLHFNGVLRGFDFLNNDGGPTPPTQYGAAGIMSLNGGVALVNGNINYLDPQVFLIPPLQEQNGGPQPINYALCVNSVGDLVTIILTDFDPVLGTPSNPNRLVTVTNVVSSTTYPVDSSTFSNILNDRKDLLPLYIVSAVVTGSGTSAATTLPNIRDVRRFVHDSDSYGPAVLTSDASQGNFRSIAAALNWLVFNSTFQNTLQIKGTYTETVDPGLNFPLNIEAGGSTASLTFSAPMNISHVNFEGMTLVFSNTVTANNCTFTNCNVTFSSTSNLGFVNFEGCYVTFGGTSTWSHVVMDPSTVNLNATVQVANLLVRDTTFNIGIAQGFTLGSGLKFANCTFNYTFHPTSGSGGYLTSDLVNAGNGMMYASISTSLNDISITGCTFTNPYTDHFPFISFQFPQIYSILQHVDISSNTFVSTATSNDIRAVISFVGNTTTPVSGANYPKVAAMAHVNVENNICNYDQMIIISASRSGASLGNPDTMLMTTNVRLTGNTCGTIAFITSSYGSLIDNDNSASVPGSGGGFTRNKKPQLVIRDNACKFIGNLDSTGQYLAFFLNSNGVTAYPTSSDATQYVANVTGAVLITGNTASWIQSGSLGTDSFFTEGNVITNNRLSPTNATYLNNFLDSHSGQAPPNVAILLRRGQASVITQDTHNLVLGNTITQNVPIISTGGSNTYYYTAGIVIYDSSTVSDNAISGGCVSGGPMIWIWGHSNATLGPNVKVNGNDLRRGTLGITAYIQAAQNTATNLVDISGNTFDSVYVDSSNTVLNDTNTNMPQVWNYIKNSNQIAYSIVSLYEHIGFAPFNLQNSNLTAVLPTGNGGNYEGFDTAYNFNSGAFQNTWYQIFDLNEVLPAGVKIAYVAVGWFTSPALVPSGLTGISWSLFQSIDTTTPSLPSLPGSSVYPLPSAMTHGILDVGYGFASANSYAPSSAAINVSTGTIATNLSTGTYLTLADMNGASVPFYTGKNYHNYFYLQLSVGSPVSATTIFASPLLIRYIWQ